METFSLFTSLYFWVITLATVGYGDFVPTTFPSRLFVTLMVLGGAALFASWASKLIALSRTKPELRARYDPDIHGGKSVVVVGSPSLMQTKSFLRELFHERYGSLGHVKVVFLIEPTPSESGGSSHGSKDAADLYAYLSDPTALGPWSGRVVLLLGSAFNPQDLERAAVERQEAIFILPNRFASDTFAQDDANIYRVIAVKKYLAFAKVKHSMLISFVRTLLITLHFLSKALPYLMRVCRRKLQQNKLLVRKMQQRSQPGFPSLQTEDNLYDSGSVATDLRSYWDQLRFLSSRIGSWTTRGSPLEAVQIIILLCRNEHRFRALAAGAQHILSQEHLDFALLGLSGLNRGTGAIISNLISARPRSSENRPHPKTAVRLQATKGILTPSIASESLFLAEYLEGASRQLASFYLATPFHGATYEEISKRLFRETRGRLSMLGMDVLQPNGTKTMLLSPPGRTLYLRRTRVYAIAADNSVYEPFTDQYEEGKAVLCTPPNTNARDSYCPRQFDLDEYEKNLRRSKALSATVLRAYAATKEQVRRTGAMIDMLTSLGSDASTINIPVAARVPPTAAYLNQGHERPSIMAGSVRTRMNVRTFSPFYRTGSPKERNIGRPATGLTFGTASARQEAIQRLSSAQPSVGEERTSTSRRDFQMRYSTESKRPLRERTLLWWRASKNAKQELRRDEGMFRSSHGLRKTFSEETGSPEEDPTVERQKHVQEIRGRVFSELLRSRLSSLRPAREPDRALIQRGGHLVILCHASTRYESLVNLLEPVRGSAVHSAQRTALANALNPCDSIPTERPISAIVILHPRQPTESEWAEVHPLSQKLTIHRTKLVPVHVSHDTWDATSNQYSRGQKSRAIHQGTRFGPAPQGLSPEDSKASPEDAECLFERQQNKSSTHGYRDLFFVKGKMTEFHDLCRTGVLTARCILIVAGSSAYSDTIAWNAKEPSVGPSAVLAGDANTLFAHALLHARIGRLLPPVICHLTNEASARLLHVTGLTFSARKAPSHMLHSPFVFVISMLQAFGANGVIPGQLLLRNFRRENVLDTEPLFEATVRGYTFPLPNYIPFLPEMVKRPRLMELLLGDSSQVPASVFEHIVHTVNRLEDASRLSGIPEVIWVPLRQIRPSSSRNLCDIFREDMGAKSIAINAILLASARASSATETITGSAASMVPCPVMIAYQCASLHTRELVQKQLGFDKMQDGDPEMWMWPSGNICVRFDRVQVQAASSNAGAIRTKLYTVPATAWKGEGLRSAADELSILPEVVSGTVYATSVAEPLLASSFYEPQIRSVCHELVSSINSGIHFVHPPQHLFIREVTCWPGTGSASVVSYGTVEYGSVYNYFMTLGLTPIGIFRHGGQVSSGCLVNLLKGCARKAHERACRTHSLEPYVAHGQGKDSDASSSSNDLEFFHAIQSYYRWRLPQIRPYADIQPVMQFDDAHVPAFVYDRGQLVGAQSILSYHARNKNHQVSPRAEEMNTMESKMPARSPGAGSPQPSNQKIESPSLVPLPFVFTCPEEDTKIKLDDLIVVVASLHNPLSASTLFVQRWIRKLLKKRALRYSKIDHRE
jgi:hypothetical protein